MRGHLPIMTTAAALLLAVACGGGEGDTPAQAGDQIAAGQQAFERNCMGCHGAQGRGSDVGPPLVHEVYEPGHHDDESFRRAVREGVVPHHWDFGPMPAFPGVPDEDIEAIIAYVRHLQRDAGIE
ncbi:MAG TPA: cytochrome c [Egibacteraceae bacterium]|nr:cytochrome c [Egibacteraceae bacterium]